MAFLMTAACRRETPVSETGAGGAAGLLSLPLTVEWAGCAGIRKGPTCEVGTNRTLTIWVADASKAEKWPVVAERGGVPVKVAAKVDVDIDGGTRLTVDVPAGARKIEIKDPGGRSRWSLAIDEARAHDEIDKLLALGRTGKYADALASLEALRARASVEEQGPTDAAIARMALALGQVDRAEPAFRASIAAAKAEGRIADVVKDGAGLLWALVHLRQRYADARALLEEMTPFGEQYPEGRVWLDYHAGLLASDTADVRTALEKYRAAERGARRLGRDSMEEESTMEVARLLTRIGRSEEAVALLRGLATPSDPCARATRELNLVWALQERAAQRKSNEGDSEAATTIVAAQVATKECPDPHRHLMAVIYAAEEALKIRDDGAAGPLVRQLESAPQDRNVSRASHQAEVIGRWYLRQGKPAAALTAFEKELPSVRAAGLLEEAFRSEVGEGRALLALGRRSAAVSRLKAAQQLLENMLRGIPLTEGRGSLLGGHDDGVRYLVAALVEGGATQEAMRVVRRARAAELAHAARLDRLARLSPDTRRRWDEALSLYQRIRAEIERQAETDWTVPRAELVRLRADRQVRAERARAALDDAYRLLVEDSGTTDFELTDPGSGELYLAFFPAPDDWLVFAATEAGVTVRRIEENRFSSAMAAASVLGLFGPRLTAARHVRLFPYGGADRVDWQAVSWKGQPLISSVSVEYGLDVGTKTSAVARTESAKTALVVSNPTGDLPAATPEADVVVRGLPEWQVTRFDGAGATRSAMLTALPKVRLFHYAGHVQMSGPGELSSALLLNGGGRVELADLLAVPSLPRLVFLSACEGAGTVAGVPSLMGLAQAFIAAGSSAAIAPTRPIRDEEARAFVAAFYGALARSHEGDVWTRAGTAEGGSLEFIRAAFRSAAMEVASRRFSGANAPVANGEHPDRTGWESFRLLVP